MSRRAWLAAGLLLAGATGAAWLGGVRDMPAPAPLAAGASSREETRSGARGGMAGGMGPAATRDGERVTLGFEQLTPEQRELAVIGGKVSPNVPFCSEDNWKRVGRDALISEIEDRRILVDPARWDAQTSGGRLGLARWASACVFDGQPIAIVDAATRRSLARYSRERGYRPAS